MPATQRPPAVITTSWDDGHPLDLRLADELARRGLKATFYVSPRNRELAAMGPGELRTLAERFEIGSHGLTHANLCRLNGQPLEAEVAGSKRELEDALGRPLDVFCYPKGRYNARVRRAVIEAGFIGARTTRILRMDAPADPWRMATTMAVRPQSWCTSFLHAARSRSATGLRLLLGAGRGRPWCDLALLLLDHVCADGGVWHIRGHSWEIEKRGLWDDLRRVLDAAAGREDVTYVTNGALLRTASGQP